MPGLQEEFQCVLLLLFLEIHYHQIASHLSLRGMYNISEIHVICHRTFKSDFTVSGIGIVASPVAKASATVPGSAQKLLLLTFWCVNRRL